MKGVFLFLANGFEEIEALATVDILRRGGVAVSTVSIHDDKYVCGAHKISVIADYTYGEFKANLQFGETYPEDVMIFPGGLPGAENLANHSELINLTRLHFAEGGTVAAICAAPGLVVPQLSNLQGREFTCYYGFQQAVCDKGAEYLDQPVVVSDNLITGRGPGCAVRFALAILETVAGDEAAEKVISSLLA